MQVSPENLLSTATLSEYFRSSFHVVHYVTFIFLEIICYNYGGLMYDYIFVALRQRCEPPRVVASQHLSWRDRYTSDFSGVG